MHIFCHWSVPNIYSHHVPEKRLMLLLGSFRHSFWRALQTIQTYPSCKVDRQLQPSTSEPSNHPQPLRTPPNHPTLLMSPEMDKPLTYKERRTLWIASWKFTDFPTPKTLDKVVGLNQPILKHINSSRIGSFPPTRVESRTSFETTYIT